MTAQTAIFEPDVIHGDARNLPVSDDSVDLIVTSPPYYGLRSYQDGGRHYHNQLGAERTPGEYLDNLVACTREMARVLKPSGSLFVNLGDKYSGYNNGSGTGRSLGGHRGTSRVPGGGDPHLYGARAKSLIGLPWRYALRCIDELDLILRAELIWHKPHGLPESVRDRVRRSHETWFHFTLNPRYYSALDQLRQPHKTASLRRVAPHRARPGRAARAGEPYSGTARQTLQRDQMLHPHGRLPNSVWEIASQPLRVPAELGVVHYASFPTEWPRRLILGWSPHQICTAADKAAAEPRSHTVSTPPDRRLAGHSNLPENTASPTHTWTPCAQQGSATRHETPPHKALPRATTSRSDDLPGKPAAPSVATRGNCSSPAPPPTQTLATATPPTPTRPRRRTRPFRRHRNHCTRRLNPRPPRHLHRRQPRLLPHRPLANP